MAYYFTTTVKGNLEETIEKVKEGLSAQGFGVLSDIDVQATMKKKLGEDFRPYRILGACNPPFAHKALQAEDKIGTMLPCNVIVQETSPGTCEVSAVDPVESMKAVSNPALGSVAGDIRSMLKTVIDGLS